MYGNIQQQTTPGDLDLCQLLQTMSLNMTHKEVSSENTTPVINIPTDMLEDPGYQSDGGSECSTSSNTVSYGCPYLQTIRSQFDNYQTTGGEYLDAIFTHREILQSYPAQHHQCARGFSDLAYQLESRAWRADREADGEAVTAFRHEAWLIASLNLPPPPSQVESVPGPAGTQSFVCLMPSML